jgi:methionine synthase II (cobalamin-independent)
MTTSRAFLRLAQAEAAPVLAVVDRPVFVSLPSPGYLAAVGSALAGPESVEAIRAAGAALAAILHAEIEALAAEGVAYVALGNPLYPPLPTTSRGYDPIAVETLLDSTPFHRLCVDFPADPVTRLPLELVKPGLVISLGVIDVSTGDLETVESILDRVDPVVEERGEFDVAIATNGGFAQSADGPTMSFDEQNEKLRLVEMVARYYWGNEI